ncbi:hypothetical protein Plhal304r1_c042g0121061 [Plasmopara halstedii]
MFIALKTKQHGAFALSIHRWLDPPIATEQNSALVVVVSFLETPQSDSRNCGPRRGHHTSGPYEIFTCPNSINSRATKLCKSVDGSTNFFYESSDRRDRH